VLLLNLNNFVVSLGLASENEFSVMNRKSDSQVRKLHNAAYFSLTLISVN